MFSHITNYQSLNQPKSFFVCGVSSKSHVAPKMQNSAEIRVHSTWFLSFWPGNSALNSRIVFIISSSGNNIYGVKRSLGEFSHNRTNSPGRFGARSCVCTFNKMALTRDSDLVIKLHFLLW